jgi:hypothetical protein
MAHNEAIIHERDVGIRDIVRQVSACIKLSRQAACVLPAWPASTQQLRMCSQIGEVNEMFQDLAVLINDQAPQVGLPAAAGLLSCGYQAAPMCPPRPPLARPGQLVIGHWLGVPLLGAGADHP